MTSDALPSTLDDDLDQARGTGTAVALCENLWQVAGAGISHDWDAAAYLVTGDRPLLIDCGSPRGTDAVAANVAALCGPVPPAAILATHGHWDHAGGAADLTARLATTLQIHPGDAGAVATGDANLTAASLLYDLPFPRVQPGGRLVDGQIFTTGGDRSATVELLHTPGHTPGSMCAVVTTSAGRRVLIAADTLWGGWHPAFGSDTAAWARSLARLADPALAADGLTFGHGISRLLTDVHERIVEAQARFGFMFDPWHKPNHTAFRW